MTYVKSYTAWQNSQDTTTPITAAKLQNIDDGVFTNDATITTVSAVAYAASSTANAAIPKSVGTTAGDLIQYTAASTPARLGIGSANQGLIVSGGAPAWASSPQSVLAASGDLLYASAANTLAKLAIGSASQILTVQGGLPSWQTGVALTNSSHSLSADVAVSQTATYVDGPQLTLAAGTYLVTGQVTFAVSAAGGSPQATVKLWDGTTSYSSGGKLVVNATEVATVPVGAILSPTASILYKLSATIESSTAGMLLKSTTPFGGNAAKASVLNAVKIG